MNMVEYTIDKLYIMEDLKDAVGAVLSSIMEMKELIKILDSDAPELDDNIKFILRDEVEKSLIELMSELDNITDEDHNEDENDEDEE
ncbi:MAG: hypothetical protein QXD03_03065 [Candidatus Anstonellales archaeon]